MESPFSPNPPTFPGSLGLICQPVPGLLVPIKEPLSAVFKGSLCGTSAAAQEQARVKVGALDALGWAATHVVFMLDTRSPLCPWKLYRGEISGDYGAIMNRAVHFCRTLPF
jgi:hypothetical protein